VIDTFQTCFGLELPEAYLRLLRYSNDGHPELDSIEPVGRPGAARWAVNHFYHLDEDRTSAVKVCVHDEGFAIVDIAPSFGGLC
jgi:hypothetical protein